MSNVRCPMCSKVNPPEAEVCAYCGARLKPVRPPSSSPAGPPKQSEPDWLRGLRGASSHPEEGASGKPSESASGKPPSEPAAGKPAPQTPPAESSDSGTPDWLSRIRERAQEDVEPAQEPAQAPDWLSGISEEPASSSSGDDFGLGPDWMNRLHNPLEVPGEPAEPSQPESPTPSPFGEFDLAGSADQSDWMRGLPGETAPGETSMDWAAGSKAEPFSAGAGEGDNEDWTKNLSAWTSEPPAGEGQAPEWGAGQPGQHAPAEPAGSAMDDMSWLDNLNFAANTPPAPGTSEPEESQGRVSSGTGLTNFLSSLDEGDVSQPGAPQFGADFQGWEPPAAENAPAETFPGWTSEESSEEPPVEAQGGTEGDISSWLKSFESEIPTTPVDASGLAAPAESTPSEQAEPGIPDWLSGGPAEPPRTPKAAPRQETGGLPAWLSSSTGVEGEPPSEATPSHPLAEGGLPGWLSGSGETPAESAPVEPAAEQAAGIEGLPAWLSSDSGTEEPSVPETPGEGVQDLTFEGLPGWLSEGEEPAAQAPDLSFASQDAGRPPIGEQATEGLPPAEGLPEAEELPESQEAQQPVWLSDFEQAGMAAETPAEPAEASEQPFAFEAGETPDWLREFSAESPGSAQVSPIFSDQQGAGMPPAGESASPFAVDLPDWLGEEAPAQPVQSAEILGEPASDHLAEAELPDWVMKMRPLESVIPGEMLPAEADQRVEKAGPLAGMRGVLPAEELVTRYRKPPIYSAKLRVTEKQRSQATLLDSLLAQETQPLLIPPVRSRAPRVILQVAIALVLVLSLLFPLMTNFELTPSQPALYPNELRNMFEELDKSLQPGAPVLLAVDYEPGYSGEMRLAASAVIDQLMTKNARIVVVSTVPTGPALAESLLQETAQQYEARNQKKFDLKNQVINLGYLPGGTVSLIEFAGIPSLAAPVTADRAQSPWNNALKSIGTISDFSQVIVLTDTAETGRAWVEQVGPSLKNVPLFMVASAQAAPMLLPYVDSGQIKGMVTGLMGGSMYSWPGGQVNNQARRYYAAYQVGVLVGLALIVIGAVTSIGMAMVKRNKKDEA